MCDLIVQEIIQGVQHPLEPLLELNALKLFKILQPYMIATDDKVRASATNLSYRVISNEQFIMTLNEEEFIVSFYLSKMIDTCSCLDSSLIILAIFNKSPNKSELCSKFIEMLQQQKLNVAALPREPRINIYGILKLVLEQKVTIESASIVLKSIGGEKDPRNILIAFQLIELLLNNKGIAKQFKQEIFSFLDCYYPIEFNENADKRFNIKKDEIVELLDKCLRNQVILSETLQMLDDKLYSSYTDAQQSALITFQTIFKEPTLSSEQANKLWEQLAKFTMDMMDDEIIEATGVTVGCLLELGKSQGNQSLLNVIVATQLKSIKELPLSQQAYLGQQILKIAIKIGIDIEITLLQQFVTLFNLKDLSVAQKRIEILLDIIVQGQLVNGNIIARVPKQLIEDILAQLFLALQSQSENCIVLSLKTIMELTSGINISAFSIISEINNYLLTQLNQYTCILAKCVLDYFRTTQVDNKQLLLSIIDNWKSIQSELYIYSLPTCFIVMDGYYLDFMNQIIQQQCTLKEDNCQEILETINCFLKQKSLPQFIIDDSKLIASNLLNICKQLSITNKSIRLQIRQLMENLIKLTINDQDIHNQIAQLCNWEVLLQLPDSFVYYYQPIITELLPQEYVLNITTELIQYLKHSMYTIDSPIQVQPRKYIYKLMEHLLLQKSSEYINELIGNAPSLESIVIRYNKDSIDNVTIYCLLLRIGAARNHQQVQNIVEQYLLDTNNKQELGYKLICKSYRVPSQQQRNEQCIIQNNEFWFKLVIQLLPHNLCRIILNTINLEYILQQVEQHSTILQYLLNIHYKEDKHINKTKEFQCILALNEQSNQGQVTTTLLSLLPNLIDINQIRSVLQVIGQSSNEGLYNLSLYKQVISIIKPLLGHKKRLVRQAAQQAISNWYLLSSKGM